MSHILQAHNDEHDVVVGNSLVDMYGKLCHMKESNLIFQSLGSRDIMSWNALITGYAQQGQSHEALNCFEQMQLEGISPDEGTFRGVLSACSHSGLLDEAEMLYGNMSKKYGVDPNIEHHTCMVMAFGGQFGLDY